jgi:hypothetical protein
LRLHLYQRYENWDGWWASRSSRLLPHHEALTYCLNADLLFILLMTHRLAVQVRLSKFGFNWRSVGVEICGRNEAGEKTLGPSLSTSGSMSTSASSSNLHLQPVKVLQNHLILGLGASPSKSTSRSGPSTYSLLPHRVLHHQSVPTHQSKSPSGSTSNSLIHEQEGVVIKRLNASPPKSSSKHTSVLLISI